MNSPTSILVGVTSLGIHVKVEGKGSFQSSPALKEFSKQMLERGYRRFVVDLLRCPVMDSTFMGTLAGIALRLREFGNGSLLVRNANERNTDLLRNLGLNNLFEVESKTPDPSENVIEAPLDADRTIGRVDQAECMIEAHEALVDADPDNLARFKDVLEYLKQDLRAGSK
ncbi:MAG: STAS domain-containing protein [Verrucomicrobia bacterium]|nr:STAS domain-containing protein [Verrucomicrobiota bacterium]MBV8376574.1 STAS domain-containing protein [Verrucomicrobiota bacterium]